MLYQAKQLLIEFHQSVIMYVILLYSNCDFNMIELTKRRREVFSTTTVTFLPLFPLLHSHPFLLHVSPNRSFMIQTVWCMAPSSLRYYAACIVPPFFFNSNAPYQGYQRPIDVQIVAADRVGHFNTIWSWTGCSWAMWIIWLRCLSTCARHCSQCTAPEDPVSNMACQFLHGRLHISFGISCITFFEDGIIYPADYPYFYLTREQRQTRRQYLYSIAGAIASEKPDCPEKYWLCNGCLVLTEYTGKTLDQRLTLRVILECVSQSKKHRDYIRTPANVVIQRILCRAQHLKDMIEHVYLLADEIFEPKAWWWIRSYRAQAQMPEFP